MDMTKISTEGAAAVFAQKPAKEMVFVNEGALTPSERRVMKRVAMGEMNATISHATGLSEPTIKMHVRNAMKKLGATNRTEAVITLLGYRQVPHTVQIETHIEQLRYRWMVNVRGEYGTQFIPELTDPRAHGTDPHSPLYVSWKAYTDALRSLGRFSDAVEGAA